MKLKNSLFLVWILGILVVSGNAVQLERDGWNLVSVCVDMNRSDIDMTGIEEIQDQDGLSIYTGDFEGNSNLHVLEAGYGYWVKGVAGSTFDGGTSQIGIEKVLKRDSWSLMGMCENISSSDINMSKFNELQSQNGQIYYSGDWAKYSNLQTLENGYGYWVDGSKGILWKAKEGPMLVASLVDSTGIVKENSSAGTKVGMVIIESMGDSPITAINLSGIGHENFLVDIDGNITLNSGAVIDYENLMNYTLSAIAVNGAGNSNSITVDINVTNEIDMVPVLSVPEEISVAEDVGIGSEIFTLETNGSNNDENSVDSYTIVGGNEMGVFDISNSGVISTVSTLDYETLKNYVLSVLATNSAGDSDTISISLKVTDVLDIPMTFVNRMINNANEAVEVKQGNHTIKLYTDAEVSANSQLNHVGIVINLNGVNSDLMSVQSDYVGEHFVATVYDENNQFIGVSDIVTLNGIMVVSVETLTDEGYSFKDDCTGNTGASNTFYAGEGTDDSPYEICSCEQLQDMNLALTSTYKLVADINCSATKNWNEGQGFEPIDFRGKFNGFGNRIVSLYISRSSQYNGLFGSTSEVKIENFGLISPTIQSNEIFTATVVGLLDGNVSNIYVIDGSVTTTGALSGGIVGQIHAGELSNSYYHGEYSLSGSWSGGLVGRVQDVNGMISNSFITASGTGTEYAVIGLSEGDPLKNIYWNNLGNSNPNNDSDKSSDDIIEIDNNESYFYSSENSPMNLWDASIWKFSETSLPILRIQN